MINAGLKSPVSRLQECARRMVLTYVLAVVAVPTNTTYYEAKRECVAT